MKLVFRVECPKCHWGYSIKSDHINRGFLKATCYHCDNQFFFKVTVSGFQTEVLQELPEGVPCTTIANTKPPKMTNLMQEELERNRKLSEES
jgi:hypothetical protein